MAGLDRQDRPSRREIGRTHNVGRGAQIRAHAHALEHGRRGDKGLRVRDAEAVFARRDGGGAGFGQGGGQEAHVRGFIAGDFFQVGVEGGIEAGGCKVGLGEVFQTFAVEGVFEVFEGEGVVEDVGVCDGGGGLTDLFQKGAAARCVRWGILGREEHASLFFGSDSRLSNRASCCKGSECCNGECGLHVFLMRGSEDAGARERLYRE